MLTRRDFLKLGGLSAAALGAGYATGKLVTNHSSSRFAVHAFLPADDAYIKRLIVLFRKKIRSSSKAGIFAESRIKTLLQSYDNEAMNEGFSNQGVVVYRVRQLENNFVSDLVISDDKNPLYVPEDDFSYPFLQLRNDMKLRQAAYLFIAEYKEVSVWDDLFNTEKRIVITNEKGVTEVLKAGSSFKNITVDGAIGKTGIELSNGIVRVTRSCCRNRICEHTLLSSPQGMIACAPNKIIIRFES